MGPGRYTRKADCRWSVIYGQYLEEAYPLQTLNSCRLFYSSMNLTLFIICVFFLGAKSRLVMTVSISKLKMKTDVDLGKLVWNRYKENDWQSFAERNNDRRFSDQFLIFPPNFGFCCPILPEKDHYYTFLPFSPRSTENPFFVIPRYSNRGAALE